MSSSHPHLSIPPETYHHQQHHPSPQEDHHQRDRLLGTIPNIIITHRNQNLQRKTSHQRRLELFQCYLQDWLFILAMVILFTLLDKTQGFQRPFDIHDPTLRRDFAEKERVPVWCLVLTSVLLPALMVISTSQLSLRSWWDTHAGCLGLLLSLSLTLAMTNLIKITVGRPRPDFLARCDPSSTALELQPIYKLSTSTICRASQTTRKFKDGFKSFPSGHSSTAWAGLGFLSLFWAGKLHLMNRKAHSPKVWLSLSPLFLATYISISRTMDGRHHWQDVCIGALLGMLIAWFSYRLYYPSLFSAQPHKPYSSRLPAQQELLPTTMQSSASVSETKTDHDRHGHGGEIGLQERRSSMDGESESVDSITPFPLHHQRDQPSRAQSPIISIQRSGGSEIKPSSPKSTM